MQLNQIQLPIENKQPSSPHMTYYRNMGEGNSPTSDKLEEGNWFK